MDALHDDLARRYRPPRHGGDTDTVGVALSGGGVRAACLSLGALQVVEERGVLRRCSHVTAVSGGAYIATAYLAARALAGRDGNGSARRAAAAWSRCSHEEEHLKRNLRYLVDGLVDLLGAVVSYLRGLLLNLLPFSASLLSASILTGLTFRALGFLDHGSDGLAVGASGERLVAAAFLLAVGAGLATRFERRQGWRHAAPIVLVAVAVGLALPDVVRAVRSAKLPPVGVAPMVAVAVGLLIVTLPAVIRTQWAVRSPARLLVRSAIRLVFGLSCVAAVLVPFAFGVGAAVESDDVGRNLALAVGGVATVVLCGLFLHANQTSLHRLYAHRLNRAYVVVAGGAGDDEGVERSGDVRLGDLELADLAGAGLPELVICAAVNLRANESAHGEAAASFVFTPSTVGSPALRYLDTEEFCRSTDRSRVRLASLIAASGAAVAPNMGRFTRKTHRFALVLFNFRLGLWMQNVFDQDHGRRGSAEGSGRRTGTLWRGWYEPGPLGTIREALGLLSLHHDFLFISDGGHWDNSGIVELLRRRCSTIFAVDASNDPLRGSNILRAMSLARSELGVDFDATASLLDNREPVLRLGFRYPDDGPGFERRQLILMRTFVSADMPADLVALERSHPAFPRHPTFNQFFSARESDGYVAFGRWLAERGIELADLPPPLEPIAADGPADGDELDLTDTSRSGVARSTP